ncbi:MAG TPA: NADH-quinone oxidoreductase subunit L [Actinomycetota bacterium]|nr:NADH-quinone oxidoreductase subunit L [Actinomycetota bacterium]
MTHEPTFGNVAPLVVAAPLAMSVLLLLVGKRIGRLAGPLASAAIGLSAVLGAAMFVGLLGEEAHGEAHNAREQVVHLFDWIRVGGLDAGADLLVDQLSIVMVLVVAGVGTLIHVYSIGYMEGDPRYPRFFAYLNLFAASMLLLVLADNLVLMFVGWEGVGLCSYLLIGFWFEKRSAAAAANKAFIVNRVGDFSFLLGIFLLFSATGSVVFGEVNGAAGQMSAGIATIAALLLFGGAAGKSAQIPLYVWLPDAMEGPTPVSALIHAATMVTAGVYMVARLSPVFAASGGDALLVVGWIGALTALWAALMAAAEYDIKRVLAYSTISQLGYMFLAHGVGAYSAGIFHLVTHAFFKALMFLGAGAVMHALAGETDMRKMGGLRRQMPVVGMTFFAGWLAISGIVPFAGFFSKDAILASAWAEGQYALWAIGLGTALLTAFYMSRLYFRVFEGKSRLEEGAHPHDAPPPMAAALVPLAVLSLVGGAINLPGILTLEHFLEPVLGVSHVPEGLTAYLLAGIALLGSVAGIGAAQVLYLSRAGSLVRRKLEARLHPLVTAARAKFYVDEIYDRTVVWPGKGLALLSANVVDRRVFDGFVNGTGGAVARFSEGLRRLQTGYVRNYAVLFLLGVVALGTVLVLRAVGG